MGGTLTEANSEPFGSPDGAAEGASGLVRFDSTWGDLQLRDHDRRIRIFVGRRGSGKSRYLRAMERHALTGAGDHDRMIVFPQRDTRISLTYLKWLHRTYSDRYERLETWRKLWNCAIYLSLASNFLNPPNSVSTKIRLSSQDRDFFVKSLESFAGSSGASLPIVFTLNHFLSRYHNRSQLQKKLDSPEWEELETRVLRVISGSTPVACYVDTLDDIFGAAPAEATDCQIALLEWIMGKVVDPNVSNRVHIVVAVRDVIFARLIAGEHGERYDRRTNVQRLDWSRRSSVHFLEQKLRFISDDFKMLPEIETDRIQAWLGRTTITNPERGGITEACVDYVLRHTRFLPREIVEIGNRLSNQVRACKRNGVMLEVDDFIQTVLEQASVIAERAVRATFDHMLALESISSTEESLDVFRERMWQQFNSVYLPTLANERFGARTLAEADVTFHNSLDGWLPAASGREFRLSEALWLHGLIGFELNGTGKPTVKYFSSSRSVEGNLSPIMPTADFYFLHSTLIGSRTINISPQHPFVETTSE